MGEATGASEGWIPSLASAMLELEEGEDRWFSRR